MRAWLVLAWGSSLAACGGAQFSCSDAAQCVLSGAQGICHATGQCAYPDGACESGYRFPAGAGGGVAGECTDGEGQGTSGDETGSTQSSASMTSVGPMGSESEGGPGSNPTSLTGMSTTAEPTSTSEPMTSSESGPIPCIQEENEPNDEPEDAVEVPNSGACEFKVEGAVGGGDPADYYLPIEFGLRCTGTPMHIDIDQDQMLRRCVLMYCGDGTAPDLQCGGGSVVAGPMYTSCCGTDDFDLTMSCLPGIELTFVVSVEGDGACTDYALTFGPPF